MGPSAPEENIRNPLLNDGMPCVSLVAKMLQADPQASVVKDISAIVV